MKETVMQAFELFGQGMLGIFVVMGLIALIVVLLEKWDRKT